MLCCAALLGSSFGLLSVATSWPTSAEPTPSAMIARGVGPGGAATAQAPSESPASVLDVSGAPAPVTPADGVQVRFATQHYAVEGTSRSGLLASLRERGPRDGDESWAASTSWSFRWSYRTAVDAGCRVVSARVDLELTSTAPEWDAPSSVSPSLVAAWDGYLDRVEVHEHGHEEIAERTAAEIVQALQALPARPSCDALGIAARDTVSVVLARHAAAQAAYDRETAHGATQGAVLAASGS
jgi:predicted secreted Zn-dependent protease